VSLLAYAAVVPGSATAIQIVGEPPKGNARLTVEHSRLLAECKRPLMLRTTLVSARARKAASAPRLGYVWVAVVCTLTSTLARTLQHLR